MKKKYVCGVEVTPEKQELLSMTATFCREQLVGDRVEFYHELWNKAAFFGLAGLPIPVEYGGSGMNVVDTMMMVETMGRECNDLGLVFSLCAHTFASAVPLWHSKSKHLIDEWLPSIARGDVICANGTTEPGSGSDVYSMKTTATRTMDGYILNGTKCFITNAPVADVFIIYASTDPSRGFLGISAFVVDAKTPGLSVKAEDQKVGLMSSPWGTVYLDDCFVRDNALIAKEGSGAALFGHSMVWERACLFAMYVGAMERVLKMCVEHARSRKQFGQAIGSNQAVSHRLVDMRVRLETSRLMLYNVGGMYDRGEKCDDAIAMSKLHISESAVQLGLDAIQIFGASAVTQNGGIVNLLLDALPGRIFSGTSDMQKFIVARSMGLK